MDLETFRAEFLNDVLVRAEIDGGFTDWAFTAVATTRLEDANEVVNFEPCHYRSRSGHIRIDGYSFDPADDSLRVFLTHRSDQDVLTTLTQTEARRLFKRLTGFLRASVTRQFEGSLDDNHPARDFAETLLEQKDKVSRIRAYLMTDSLLSKAVRDWPEGTIEGVAVEYHIWDISRFHRAHLSSTGLDDLVIDFQEDLAEGLPCLEASTAESPYSAFLCVIPASVLAKVYDQYGSRLLEGNVRAFLSVKGKVNYGIRKTLIERPEMFFAYNNGISAVASSVVVTRTTGGARLISATNLQIVNGGQTTASIFNVGRLKESRQLHDTFVPMKLSVVDGEQSAVMIKDISRYANTQNKVNDADFFANHPFHQRLEQISRRTLAPALAGMQHETRWYYERARGQYLNEFVKMSKAQRERAKLILPKSQIITKPDLAKSELSWAQRPHIVSQGAQTAFLDFARRIDAAWEVDPNKFHDEYFRRAAARIIVFRGTERLILTQPWYLGGYRANIVTYTIAKLSHDVDEARRGVIDVKRIWRHQDLHPELTAQLAAIAEQVYGVLTAPVGQQNVTQWAKREECWVRVRQLTIPLSHDIIGTLVDESDVRDDARAAKASQQVDSGIDAQRAVLALGIDYWLELNSWAERRGGLAPSDQSALRIAAGIGGNIPNERQCRRLLQLRRHFEDDGFTTIIRSPADFESGSTGA
jgi:AIPR protein/abortive infection phage resistance-like protein